jgi:hypothetical protein
MTSTAIRINKKSVADFFHYAQKLLSPALRQLLPGGLYKTRKQGKLDVAQKGPRIVDKCSAAAK